MGTAFGCLAASSLQPLGVALSAPQVQGSALDCIRLITMHLMHLHASSAKGSVFCIFGSSGCAEM